MNLNYNREELQFRDEVRQFLDRELPPDMRERGMTRHEPSVGDIRRWQGILHARGWGASMWPVEFGGTGWGPVKQHLFELECALASAPLQLPFGLRMIAPVIMNFGNSHQKEHFLPRILTGEHWWCQGYSEPGAGSDLASLKTQAKRTGDHYIVNGQKAWNTWGQHADWIFCLVRTDPGAKPQRGISLLLIDMKSPGVTVRPTTLLDGTQEVNEIWFEDVKVPKENLVGEENKGWTYAKFLLSYERVGVAGVGGSRSALERLKAIASRERRGAPPLISEPRFRMRLAQLEIELAALEITSLRVSVAASEKQAPGPEASILKIRGSEIRQALSELLLESSGCYALPFSRPDADPNTPVQLPGPAHASGASATYLNLRKLSIFSGSNEIQKNIISQMILGL